MKKHASLEIIKNICRFAKPQNANVIKYILGDRTELCYVHVREKNNYFDKNSCS